MLQTSQDPPLPQAQPTTPCAASPPWQEPLGTTAKNMVIHCTLHSLSFSVFQHRHFSLKRKPSRRHTSFKNMSNCQINVMVNTGQHHEFGCTVGIAERDGSWRLADTCHFLGFSHPLLSLFLCSPTSATRAGPHQPVHLQPAGVYG